MRTTQSLPAGRSGQVLLAPGLSDTGSGQVITVSVGTGLATIGYPASSASPSASEHFAQLDDLVPAWPDADGGDGGADEVLDRPNVALRVLGQVVYVLR